MPSLESLRAKYKSQLEPFIQLLLEKRDEVSKSDWAKSVQKLEHSVMKTPEQYLSDVATRNRDTLKLIVKDIFTEAFELNEKQVSE